MHSESILRYGRHKTSRVKTSAETGTKQAASILDTSGTKHTETTLYYGGLRAYRVKSIAGQAESLQKDLDSATSRRQSKSNFYLSLTQNKT